MSLSSCGHALLVYREENGVSEAFWYCGAGCVQFDGFGSSVADRQNPAVFCRAVCGSANGSEGLVAMDQSGGSSHEATA